MPSTTTERSLDLSLSESELERHREHITDFIATQADAAGADAAVIALSGGIDSTLTAYLAVEALGADSVYGLVLPSEVNREGNMSDAERVASELLGIEYDVVEIGPVVDAIVEAVPGTDVTDAPTDEPEQVAIGNTRARVRSVFNYFVANRDNGLVLGTGNKSEALVGYFTKYGDGAVDCLPIANLYKQQVRQLAASLGVPADLVDQTPTAGMWDGQTDEAELGLDYDTVDAILALHIDGPLSTTATTRTLDGVDRSQIERVEALVAESTHKRSMPPAPSPLA